MRPSQKLLGLLGFVFFSCGAQAAQQIERTRVGEYELGETYAEMVLPEAQKEMDTVCPQAEAQYTANIPKWILTDQKIGDDLRATLAVCNAFADFRAGKNGQFKLPKEELKPGVDAVRVKFDGGKIDEVSILWKPDETSFDAERLTLTKKYGVPEKTVSIEFQNGISAMWHCEQASWSLKNGDHIIVFDGVVSSHHRISVAFVWKNKAQVSKVKNSH
jgi:hypothetical protein